MSIVCVGAFECLSMRTTDRSAVFWTPGRFEPGAGNAKVHMKANEARDKRKR